MASIISASTTSGTALNMSADTTGVLQLATGATPTTAVTIDTSQNVGIGTASPAYKLDVVGSLNVTADSFYRIGAGTDRFITYRTGNSDILYSFASGNFYRQDITNSTHSWWTGNTERMRIDSSGNLSIGTSSTGGRLTVYASSQNGIELRTTTTADGIYGLYNTAGSSGNAVYVLPCRFGSTNTFAGGVYWSGSVMQYTGTSDIRLKENIIDAGSGLDKLANIKVRSFDWKESGSHVDFGVIAQELEEVAPEAVAKGKDNEDGSIDTPYAVDTSVLVPAMIKAIQEQQTIINDLKARVTALEAK